MSHPESDSYPVLPSTENVQDHTMSTLDNASAGAQSAKDTIVGGESIQLPAPNTTTTTTATDLYLGASNAYTSAANHPFTQNVKNTVSNGPVAENVRDQALKTSNEFSNLASTRQRPTAKTATGQQLTHYHSFFSSLFSWENPRASAVAYVSVILFIFGARYLDLLRYAFKLTWMALGVSIAAEVAGRSLFNTGFASQMRPRKYYVVPKETLDEMSRDLDELINFFTIESQRLLFAENVFASCAAFLGAFTSYYLIKIMPFWGLSLIATSVLFLTPLIYKSNKELIDEQIAHASTIVNQQTTQVKELATQQVSAAAASTKHFVGDYSAKITNRARSVSPTFTKASSPVAATHGAHTVPTHSGPMPTGVVPTAPAHEKHAAALTTAPDVAATAESAHGLNSEDFPVVPAQSVEGGAVKTEVPEVPSVGSVAEKMREENEKMFS